MRTVSVKSILQFNLNANNLLEIYQIDFCCNAVV